MAVITLGTLSLIASASIGDRVWSDTNGDGVQDLGESGIAGVTVTLTNPDGSIDTVMTGANGEYDFTGLAAGTYTVTVGSGPNGATITTPGSDSVLLVAGQDYDTADFGFQPALLPASVGDRVWLDDNGNGVQDAGENGIDGVLVSLNAGGVLAATTTTSGGGFYVFSDLPAGTYTIMVDPATLPAGVGTQSGDPDATLDNMSTVTLARGENNRLQDFGYGPMLCYAVADESNGNGFADALVRINRTDGTSQVVGETGTAAIEAAAFVPVDVAGTLQQVLFAVANPGNPNTASANTLGRIDLATGLWSPLPNPIGSGTDAGGTLFDFTMSGDIDGLAYDVQRDILWATQRNGGDGNPDILLQLDPSTGRLVEDAFGADVDWFTVPLATDPAFQTSSGFPYDNVDDIAVNPLDGRIYIINNKDGTGGGLVELNPAGAVISYIGLFTGTTSADGIVDDMEGLAFAEDGRLHGTTADNGPDESDLNKLFVIDPATAATTFVGDFPNNAKDIEAVACLTGPPPPPGANADLLIEKDLVSASPLIAGTTAEYLLTVSNAGPGTATNTVLTDLGGLGLIPVGPSVFDVGDLAAGSTTSVTVTVLVTNDSRSVLCRITNTATVASDTLDLDLTSNQAASTNPVQSVVDLFVTKEGPAVLMAPGTLSYSVTVGNNGPSAPSSRGTALIVEDTLPMIPGVPPMVDPVFDTPGLWFPGPLAPGGSSDYTVVYAISDCCTELTVTNRVTVEFGQKVCDDVDPDLSNNVAVVVTRIVPNNVPPMFIDPPTNVVLSCEAGQPPPVALMAMDDCDANVIVTVATNRMGASCHGVASFEYVYTASDSCGNTAVHTQSVTYVDNQPPVIVRCPADDNGGNVIPPPDPNAVVAMDNCGNVTVVMPFAVTSFTACAQQVIYRYEATDDCGNTTNCNQIITIALPSTPTITCLPDETFDCTADPAPTMPTVSDPCNTPQLFVTTNQTSNGCGPVLEVVFRAVNAFGNEASCTQTFTYVDTQVPMITSCPADLDLPAGAAIPPPDPGAVIAMDNCGSVTVVMPFAVTSFTACAQQVIYRYEATDDCGNTTNCNQIITIALPSTPIITCLPDETFDCTADPAPTMPTVSDPCDTPQLFVTTNQTSNGCGPVLEVVFRAVNAYGNEASCTQTFTYVDDRAPILLGCTPGVIRLAGDRDCRAALPDPDVTANDNCDPTASVTYDLPPGTILSGPGPHIVDVMAVDLCGNQTNCSLSFEIDCPEDVRVGDFIWEDLDGNGRQDAGEPGVPGVEVCAVRCGVNLASRSDKGALPPCVLSGVDGRFALRLPPGDWELQYTLPPGTRATVADAFGDTVDSDADPNTLRSTRCTGPLGAGDEDLNLDVGLFTPPELGGTIWIDNDGDGNTVGDNLLMLGLSDVEVAVSSVDRFGVLTRVATAVSRRIPNNGGFYIETDLVPGLYQLDVDLSTVPDTLPIRTTPMSYRVKVGSGDQSFTNNFGFAPAPTAVELESAEATADGVRWMTAWEDGTLGFHVYRADSGERIRVNERLILGGQHAYEVRDAQPGPALYEIEEVSTDLNVEVVARVGLATPLGEPVQDLQAADSGVTFTAKAGVSYLVFGLRETYHTTDVTDPESPIPLRVERLSGDGEFAAYFSWLDGRVVRIAAP